jgi:hypothetical protein
MVYSSTCKCRQKAFLTKSYAQIGDRDRENAMNWTANAVPVPAFRPELDSSPGAGHLEEFCGPSKRKWRVSGEDCA